MLFFLASSGIHPNDPNIGLVLAVVMVCDGLGHVFSAMSLSLCSLIDLIGGLSCSYSVSSQDITEPNKCRGRGTFESFARTAHGP